MEFQEELMADLEDAAHLLTWVWSTACVWCFVLHGFLHGDMQLHRRVAPIVALKSHSDIVLDGLIDLFIYEENPNFVILTCT